MNKFKSIIWGVLWSWDLGQNVRLGAVTWFIFFSFVMYKLN